MIQPPLRQSLINKVKRVKTRVDVGNETSKARVHRSRLPSFIDLSALHSSLGSDFRALHLMVEGIAILCLQLDRSISRDFWQRNAAEKQLIPSRRFIPRTEKVINEREADFCWIINDPVGWC